MVLLLHYGKYGRWGREGGYSGHCIGAYLLYAVGLHYFEIGFLRLFYHLLPLYYKEAALCAVFLLLQFAQFLYLVCRYGIHTCKVTFFINNICVIFAVRV